jgi:GTP1/Obg family GTP-binding protein
MLLSITFIQPFSLPLIFSLVIGIATIAFILRLIRMKIPQLKPPFTLPTILIAGVPGAGKTSLFNRFISDNKEKILIKDGSYAVGIMKLSDGRSFQLLDAPKFILPSDGESLKGRVDLILFIFDASRQSPPILTQLNFMQNLEKMFEGVPIFPIINTKDSPDNKKIRELNKLLYPDVPRISIKDEKLDTLRDIFSRFL